MEYENLPKYHVVNGLGIALYALGLLALVLNIAGVIFSLANGGEIYGVNEFPAAAAFLMGGVSSLGMIVFGQLLMIVARIATEQVKQTVCLEHLVRRNG